jgi:CubicO group peptidase (beta-lactamase class C family)
MKKSAKYFPNYSCLQFIFAIGLIFFACGCRTFFTPLPPKETRTYQSILEWSHNNGMPGAILLVQTPQTNFLGAIGWADVKQKIPMQPDNEFRIGSITKMFVGVTAAKLQKDGLLNTDLPITNYLPKSVTDHIANSDRITVRELLSMQSGIYNYTENPWWILRYGFLDRRGCWPPLRHLKYAYDKPAKFPPGKGWEYSNSNFILLGLIIENVAGHPLSIEIRKQILNPLQLTNTYYELGEPTCGKRAHGYESFLGCSWDTYGWTPIVGGSAGLVSTVSDLAVFVRTAASTNCLGMNPGFSVPGYDWGIMWQRASRDSKTPLAEEPVFLDTKARSPAIFPSPGMNQKTTSLSFGLALPCLPSLVMTTGASSIRSNKPCLNLPSKKLAENKTAFSPQTHRINIHHECHVFGQGERLDDFRQGLAQFAHRARPQHDLVAVKSFRPQQRRRRRSGND